MISIDRLVAAYKDLGFIQRPDDPQVFERSSDGLMLFHAPFGEEIELEFILEDVARWDPDLADQLRNAIKMH